jgi:formylglycine-generating enzyme required for sulfatase activity
LLAGKAAYDGETLMAKLLAHRESPIPSLGADVPQPVQAVFRKMVAKTVEDRYQAMGEVVAALEPCGSGQPASLSVQQPVDTGLDADALTFLRDMATRTTHQPKPTKQAAPAKPGKGNKRVILAAVGAALLVLLLGVVLALTLRGGELVVEIDEQLGKDVQVVVSQGGEKVEIADAKSGWTLSLNAGKYDLSVQGGDDRFLLDSRSVVVKRGESLKVRVTMKPPEPAVAPFDENQARKHQEAWARYLGVPLETTNAIGMTLVLIPPGEFMMGEPGQDWHKVRITRPFYLGKYEVTQAEWKAVTGSNPSEFKGPKNPVEKVCWEDCQLFLDKLSQKCGLGQGSYRLPTEAQWEYACRAGTGGRWFFGENEMELKDYAWYKDNLEQKTHSVGEKKANPWGLYDVYGKTCLPNTTIRLMGVV